VPDFDIPQSTLRALSLAGLCLLTFLAGSLTTAFETFPYPQLLERPIAALEAQLGRAQSPFAGDQAGDDSGEHGVTHHDPEKAYQGLTLYTSEHEQAANLVAMDGEVVHRWELPFREVWPDPPHVDRPVDADQIHWNAVHMYPDGRLLASYSGDGDTPHGYGLVEMTADSEVVWRFAERTHHDIEVGPEGDIYVLTHDVRDRDEVSEEVGGDSAFVIDNEIVRLSPGGEVLGRWSLADLLADSSSSHVLRLWFDRRTAWDPLHANDVDVVDESFARHHAFAEPGQLIVSLRSLDALVLVDPADGTVEWVERGPWLAQHDPDLLAAGHILVFDNHGHAGPEGASRIVEYAPSERSVVWEYVGTEAQPFDSNWQGGQLPLPNGNVLVVESVGGRLFEVTRDGEIVWEFHNPARVDGRGGTVVPNIRASVQRVRREELSFVP
jgi:hypothetical protein